MNIFEIFKTIKAILLGPSGCGTTSSMITPNIEKQNKDDKNVEK